MSKSRDSRGASTLPRDDGSFPVYTAAELAKMLGVNTATLGQWRIKGKGPKFIRETPKTVVYLRETVHQWLKDHEQHTQVTYKKKTKAKRPKRSNNSPPTEAASESPGA
jgi:hypothetical protein